MTKIVVLIFVILPQFYTFLSTFHSLVLLIKTINTYVCYQFWGLDFLLLTGNWGKNTVAEAEVAKVEAG